MAYAIPTIKANLHNQTAREYIDFGEERAVGLPELVGKAVVGLLEGEMLQRLLPPLLLSLQDFAFFVQIVTENLLKIISDLSLDGKQPIVHFRFSLRLKRRIESRETCKRKSKTAPESEKSFPQLK